LVLTALRADFYGHAARYPELAAALKERQILVEPMTRRQLWEAIEKPATANGWTVADGLAEIILNDLGSDTTTAAALPVLSHAMLSTWNRRDGKQLTVAGYRATGGITYAIRKSAESVYTSADQSGRHALRMMLPRLVRAGIDGDADTAQPTDRAVLVRGVADPGTADQMLARLVEARLITMDRDTVRLAHEALLREWPRLREWIDTDRDWLRRSQRVIADSRRWQQSGCESALLYRGSQLAAIREREIPADQDPILADPLATEFVAAAVGAESLRTRRRRAVTATLVVLVIALTVTTGIAVWARNQATQQRDTAIARELAGRSEQLASTDPVGSQLAALTAWRTKEIPEARYAMLAAARNPAIHPIDAGSGAPGSMALSPDGHTLATAAGAKGVLLWDTRTGDRIDPPLTVPTGVIDLVAFSSDGLTLATSGGYYTARLWDIGSRRQVGRTITTQGGKVESMALSSDGRTLAIGSGDRMVRLWDTATGQQIGRPLPTGHAVPKNPVAFTPDGRTLAASGVDNGTVQLWDARTGTRRGPPISTGHTGTAKPVAFTPDGRAIATSNLTDGTVLFSDIDTGAQIGPSFPVSRPGRVSPIALSPDGRTLAAGGNDGMRLWDTGTGRQIGRPLSVRTGTVVSAGSVSSVTFSPDGRTLASHNGGAIWLWDTATGRQVGRTLTVPTGSAALGELSSDGSTLTTISGDTVSLWDTRTGETISPSFTISVSALSGVALSYDRRTLAIGAGGGTVQLWDTRTGDPIGRPLTGHRGRVISLAFSRDGQMLATGSEDNTARLWDLRSHHQVGPTLESPSGVVSSVEFSRDGDTLTTGSSFGTVQAWNTRTGAQASEFRTPGAVSSLASSPDGRTLAVGGGDGTSATVSLWDTVTGRQIGLPFPVPVGAAGSRWVPSVAFGPDGHTLVTIDNSNTARWWDVGFNVDVAAFLCSRIGDLHTTAHPVPDLPEIPDPQQLCPARQ
ncbi:WD40 repeat domain-containing protein, partial [Nocardia carnea]|uniref:WD40 repeat domain-containing protein n=1 Tax=Nocardia carnea TaxID=37328 RepID=UPI0012F6D941